MITRTKTLYEVIVWMDAENPQQPDGQYHFTRKADAFKIARTIKRTYGLVEVNRLSVTPWDENDIHGCDLLASWTNGKQTA